MKILLVAATMLELNPILKQLNHNNCSFEVNNEIIYNGLSIDYIITGLGLVFTSYQMAKALIKQKYDLVINLGIAGSFNKDIKIGEIVNVSEEEFSDLGIESPIGFRTIFETGFTDKNEFPFKDGKLVSNHLKYRQIESLRQVKSTSSNTAHGNELTIDELIKKFNPDIESMEGAAFFYVCLMEKVQFLQIRAISNYVEPRNVKNWNISLAINNLSTFILNFLNDLNQILVKN